MPARLPRGASPVVANPRFGGQVQAPAPAPVPEPTAAPMQAATPAPVPTPTPTPSITPRLPRGASMPQLNPRFGAEAAVASRTAVPTAVPTVDRPQQAETNSFLGAFQAGLPSLYSAGGQMAVAYGLFDPNEAAEFIAEQNRLSEKEIGERPGYAREFYETMEREGADVDAALEQGQYGRAALEAAGQIGHALTSPRGLGYSVLENLPYSLPGIATGYAGAKGGAAAGAAAGTAIAPGPGTVIGGVAGGLTGAAAGGFVGQVPVEVGAWMNQALQERGYNITDPNSLRKAYSDPVLMKEIRAEAERKGVTTAGVDALFQLVAGRLSAGGKGKGFLNRTARGAGDVAVESVGEATGEAAGQYAATGEVSAGEAITEGVTSLGQSAAQTGIGYGARRAAGLRGVQDAPPPTPQGQPQPQPQQGQPQGAKEPPQAPPAPQQQPAQPTAPTGQGTAQQPPQGPQPAPAAPSQPDGRPAWVPPTAIAITEDDEGKPLDETIWVNPDTLEPYQPPEAVQGAPGSSQEPETPPQGTQTPQEPVSTPQEPEIQPDADPEAELDRRAREIYNSPDNSRSLREIKDELRNQPDDAPLAPETPQPEPQKAQEPEQPSTLTGPVREYITGGKGRLTPADIAKKAGIPEEEAQSGLDAAVREGLIRQTKGRMGKDKDGNPIQIKPPRYLRKPERGPLSLVQWIGTKGGLNDRDGRIAAMGGLSHWEPGIGKVFKKNGGLADDDLLRQAVEDGYLRTEDIEEFYDKIDNTLRGNPYYRPDDTQTLQDRQVEDPAERRDAMEADADEAGIDYEGLSDDELESALAAASEPEAPAEQAQPVDVETAFDLDDLEAKADDPAQDGTYEQDEDAADDEIDRLVREVESGEWNREPVEAGGPTTGIDDDIPFETADTPTAPPVGTETSGDTGGSVRAGEESPRPAGEPAADRPDAADRPSASQEGQAPTAGVEPTYESVDTADGPGQQAVIPGAEQSAQQAAQSRPERIKAGKPQQAADEGLFGEGHKQKDIFDAPADDNTPVPQVSDKQPVSTSRVNKYSDWKDLGDGWQVREQTNGSRQQIKNPDGDIVTRGLDTRGEPYWEVETGQLPTSSVLDEIEKKLVDRFGSAARLEGPEKVEKSDQKPETPKKSEPKKVRGRNTGWPDRMANYFRPGRIVPSYGGWDRVISFQREGDDGWTVTVTATDKDGNPDPSDKRVRTHATSPKDRDLNAWEKENPPSAFLAESNTGPEPFTLQRILDAKKRRKDLTMDERKELVQAIIDNSDSVKAVLSAMTKRQLMQNFGLLRYKNDKKEMMVRAAYTQILTDMIPGDSYTWSPMEETIEEAVQRLLKEAEAETTPAAEQTTPKKEVEAERDKVADPTPAQAEAGNYQKGHIKWRGLDITIETPKGGTRRKVNEDGSTAWEVRNMPVDYGYFKRTEGADGEQIDVFIGNPHGVGANVWVMDQKNLDGSFDEHKVFIGFNTKRAAMMAYKGSFSNGFHSKVMGPMKKMGRDEIAKWLEEKQVKPLQPEKAEAKGDDFALEQEDARPPEPEKIDQETVTWLRLIGVDDETIEKMTPKQRADRIAKERKKAEKVPFVDTPFNMSDAGVGMHFYISTGEKGAMRTLREVSVRNVQRGNGKLYVPFNSDHYRINLARDLDKSIEKAKVYIAARTNMSLYQPKLYVAGDKSLNDYERDNYRSASQSERDTLRDRSMEVYDQTMAYLETEGEITLTVDGEKRTLSTRHIDFNPASKGNIEVFIGDRWQELTDAETLDLKEKTKSGKSGIDPDSEIDTDSGLETQKLVDALAMRGLAVTKTTTAKGKPVWEVTGKGTFKAKDKIKELGGRFYGPKKAWSFYDGDPSKKILAALTGAGQDTSGEQSAEDDAGPDIDAAEYERLRDERERQDARADERESIGNVAGKVSNGTRELLRRGLEKGIPEEVVNNQIEDVGLITTAYKAEKPLFLLGNDAGTGKTFVLGAAMREIQEAGQDGFVYVTKSQDLIAQIERDLAAYGLKNVQFVTYNGLSTSSGTGLNPEGKVVIFDEAHSLKNVGSSKVSEIGMNLMERAKMTVLASATPFENPVQAQYLDATGIFNVAGGFNDWAKMYGASVRRRKFYNYRTGEQEVQEIVYWSGGKHLKNDSAAAREWFFKQAIMTQREMKLPAEMVDVDFIRADADKKWEDVYFQIEEAYEAALQQTLDENGKPVDATVYSGIAMHRQNAIKRVLEAAKVQDGIDRAKKHLGDDKSVVLFVETKSDRVFGKWRKSGKQRTNELYEYPQMVEMMAEWRQEAQIARQMGSRPPPQPFADFIMVIARSFHERDIMFELPSTSDMIQEQLKEYGVGVYTGAVTPAKATKAKKQFLEGDLRVLIATMAKGGTGLSLHDEIGNRPTVQVNINLPWTATQVAQVSARIARYGLKSKAQVEWLFAKNIPWEAQVLAPRVGSRMRDMGAVVKGVEIKAAEALSDFDFEGTVNVSQEAGTGQIDLGERDIYTEAEKLEKTRMKAANTAGGFFETPLPLAALMNNISGVRKGDKVLEPSAGTGNLLRFVPDGVEITAVERRADNWNKLKGKYGDRALNEDFLEFAAGTAERFDTILMNPPFERVKGIGPQDIAHVQAAYDLLEPGGRLVAIMSEGVFFRSMKQDESFRQWLDDVGATVIEMPENAFKQSGTGVRSRMVVIDQGADPGRSDMRLGNMEINSLKEIELSVPSRNRQDDGINVDEADSEKPKLSTNVTVDNFRQEPISREGLNKLAQALRERLDQLGLKDIGVALVERITDIVEGGREVEGAGRYLNRLIEMSLQMDDDTAMGELNHEIIHALKDLDLFTEAEWKALERVAKATWMQEYNIGNRYDYLSESEQLEEAIAHAFADYARTQPKGVPAIVRAFKKVLDALKGIYRALAGEGIITPEQIFGEIETGRIGRRERPKAKDRKKPGYYDPLPVSKLSQIDMGQKYKGEEVPEDEKVWQGPSTKNPEQLLDLDFTIASETTLSALRDKSMPFWSRLRRGVSRANLKGSWTETQERLQDQFIWLKKAQEEIQKQLGRPLTEQEDAYLSTTLYSGRAGEKLLMLDHDILQPFLDAVYDSGVAFEDIEYYVASLHAEERNAQIAKINPRFKDVGPDEPGGSGWSANEIDEAKATAEREGWDEKLGDVVKGLRKILDFHLETRVEGGLWSEKDATRMKAVYKNYVPMRGLSDLEIEEEVIFGRTGKGFSVHGPESQRATGRKTKAKNIIAHSVLLAQEAVIRSEKNRVGQHLFNLAQNAPNKKFWETDRAVHKPVLNRKTGLVEYKAVNTLDEEERAKTLRVKINGKEHRVYMHDIRLARGMKNMNADQVGAVAQALMNVNRWLSTVNTGLNPEFMITNAIRDAQTAGINLQQYDLDGLTMDTFKNYFKALKGAWGGVKGLKDTEWQKYFREFAAAGGRVSFFKIDDLEDQMTNLQKELSRRGPGGRKFAKAPLREMRDFMDNANSAVDNAIRLSLYVALRKRGATEAFAANAAKNLTVNFNKHGSWGPVINGLYLFYNASIQGTAVIFRALGHRKVRQIVAGAVLLGAMQELLNSMLAADDDDDGLTEWDELDDFHKQRNIIIVNPSGGNHFKMPLPYGYNWFFNMGREFAAFARGHQDVGKTTSNLLLSAFDVFNPIGGAESFWNLIAPTVVDPAVDALDNRDFAGRPIVPEVYPGQEWIPNSQRAFRGTSEIWRQPAEWLNNLTGGSEYESGLVDISPEWIQYGWNTVFGGMGAFIQRTVTLPEKLWNGEANINDVPFVRRVIGGAPGYLAKSRAYDRINEIEAMQARVREMERDENFEAQRSYEDKNAPKLDLYRDALKLRRALRDLRKERDSILAQGLGFAERNAALERIQKEERLVISDFMVLYNDADAVMNPGQAARREATQGARNVARDVVGME